MKPRHFAHLADIMDVLRLVGLTFVSMYTAARLSCWHRWLRLADEKYNVYVLSRTFARNIHEGTR